MNAVSFLFFARSAHRELDELLSVHGIVAHCTVRNYRRGIPVVLPESGFKMLMPSLMSSARRGSYAELRGRSHCSGLETG